MIQDYEKLGVFYLGRLFDHSSGQTRPDYLLYDSKDLLTHAVCVGMTGSGKTGLCLGLLEEAAIDAIPALVIDPKGDLGNLMLTFPNLAPEEFTPWINEEEARLAGFSKEDYAHNQAELWKKGLKEWNQDADRIVRLRQAAEVVLYTPGSGAGIPVAMLKSFSAPDPTILEDRELLGDRLNGTVSSLLGLLDIEADPLQSREHILLTQILKQAWIKGETMDLGTLILLIQKPPFSRVGVMELESFFPEKDRFGLSMQLNNLLAAPGFESWMEDVPLDISSFLYSPSGKPRIAIFSIAHLSDSERMFFVSVLLQQLLGWVRTQSGTTSLRALFYMDEIFGFFPPVANPPSKKPLLTLLKQARAFGLGMVLATQNPVDLDYKGLANCGTWFIGRLQTEHDKARVLDGLEGSSNTGGQDFNRRQIEELLSSLEKRVFLLHNVHEKAPILFQTRWTLSYLRGPLTKNQIRMLMSQKKALPAESVPAPAAKAASPAGLADGQSISSPSSAFSRQPVLPPEIRQQFLPVRCELPPGTSLVYAPRILGLATVYYQDAKKKVDATQQAAFLHKPEESSWGSEWKNAEQVSIEEADLEEMPSSRSALFAPLPAETGKAGILDTWKKSLRENLYRTQKMELWQCPRTGQVSQPEENERDFRLRISQSLREERDRQKERLQQKYAPKLNALQEKILRSRQAVQKERSDAQQQTLQTAISIGSTLLGALWGRRTLSSANIGRAASSVRGIGKTVKETQDISRAQESLTMLQQQLQELQDQMDSECRGLDFNMDPASETLEQIFLKPKKTDITVSLVALAWLPCIQPKDSNSLDPAWP